MTELDEALKKSRGILHDSIAVSYVEALIGSGHKLVDVMKSWDAIEMVYMSKQSESDWISYTHERKRKAERDASHCRES